MAVEMNKICPVCGLEQIQDSQCCERCGWEFSVLLGSLDQVGTYLTKRLDEAKTAWQQRRYNPELVPELQRDSFETVDEFSARLVERCWYVGDVELQKSGYDIKTGYFPLRLIKAHEWVRSWLADLDAMYLCISRELAYQLYRQSAIWPLYAQLVVQNKRVLLDALMLITHEGAIPVKRVLSASQTEVEAEGVKHIVQYRIKRHKRFLLGDITSVQLVLEGKVGLHLPEMVLVGNPHNLPITLNDDCHVLLNLPPRVLSSNDERIPVPLEHCGHNLFVRLFFKHSKDAKTIRLLNSKAEEFPAGLNRATQYPRALVQRLPGEIRSQLSEEVCPYCFDTFKLNNTPFRCRSPANLCSHMSDPMLEKVWKDRRPVGRVLTPPPGRFATQMLCSNCDQRSTVRLCPRCHQTLPHTFAEHRNYIFAVIGAKGAGKSNYIPALIEQIKSNLGPRMDMLLRPANDFTITRYKNDFYDPLFRNHKVVVATQSALADSTIQLPMTFTLTFSGHGWLGDKRIERAVTISFFDTAGEDLKAEDIINTVNKYIYRSDGIILLLDPLQLDPVRDKLGKSVPLPPQDIETSDIVTRVSTVIRKGLSLKSSDRIPIPLALVLSKLDAVQPLLDSQMQVHADDPRMGNGIDLADFHTTDAELRSQLDDWGSSHLLQQVSIDFKHCGFFGVSALGCQPTETGEVSSVVPKRVTDPFLWLLYCQGLVKRME